MTSNFKETKMVTGLVRFSYLHVFEPEKIDENSDAKYSVSLIIPKKDKKTIELIKERINNAILNGKQGKFQGKVPANLKTPLRDGDVERPEDEAYEDSYFINASCKTKPGVVNKDRQPIIEQDEVYSGCYGLASITFYPFNTSGNKGIACGLNHIMKISDGEPLGGRNSAESDFADVDIKSYESELKEVSASADEETNVDDLF